MEISAFSAREVQKYQTQRDPLRKCNVELEDESTAAATQLAHDDCFSCNICLLLVIEPVVTLCGHLYCWACIYRWLQVESAAGRQCPVCKAPLSHNTLVPLYGRGDLRSSSSTKEADPEIPRRSSLPHRAIIDSVLAPCSPPWGLNQERRSIRPVHDVPVLSPLSQHHRQGDYYTGDVPTSPTFRSTRDEALGGLATIIPPWISSGREEASRLLASPRVLGRRQIRLLGRRQMQMESCLNQLWHFLFCFVLLCLFFF